MYRIGEEQRIVLEMGVSAWTKCSLFGRCVKSMYPASGNQRLIL